jgi:hypothetical protein
MPVQDPQITAGVQRMEESFGDRFTCLLWELAHYATTGQTFDVTFYDREPLIEVTLDDIFASKFLAAHEPRYALQLCNQIRFSDGTVAPIDSIWTLNFMPAGGIDNETLNSVDLMRAEVRAGQNGETIREMIRVTYRCGSGAEEDYFVRRWIAS